MSTRSTTPPPEISSRPHRAEIARRMSAPPSTLFEAWTGGIDRWLAAPGSVVMTPEVGTLFFFETHHGAFRAPYYGRFLRIEPDRLIEMGWVSIGTGGLETVVTVELRPEGEGALLRLTHAGFADEQLADDHRQAWLVLLEELESRTRDEGI